MHACVSMCAHVCGSENHLQVFSIIAGCPLLFFEIDLLLKVRLIALGKLAAGEPQGWADRHRLPFFLGFSYGLWGSRRMS